MRSAVVLLSLAWSLMPACGREATRTSEPRPRRDAAAPVDARPSAGPDAAPAPTADATAATAATPTTDATAAAAPGGTDPENRKAPPADDPELGRQGRALLAAIAAGDPELARGFFFPREAFKPLKNVRDPDHYWRYLWELYAHEIRTLHGKRRDWKAAELASLRPGTPPKWIRPGVEANRIGYWRTFRSPLAYRVGGRQYRIVVDTMISWDGHWHVTHLLPLRPPMR
jgi:hypothetical protein